jgi:transposase
VRRALIWRSCAGGRHDGRSYPSELSDAEWAVLEPLLPPPPRIGRPLKWPRRVIAEAIFYLVRPGCAWRMLPVLPAGRTVHSQLRQLAVDRDHPGRSPASPRTCLGRQRLHRPFATWLSKARSWRVEVPFAASARPGVTSWRRNPRAFRSPRAAGRSNAPWPGCPARDAAPATTKIFLKPAPP